MSPQENPPSFNTTGPDSCAPTTATVPKHFLHDVREFASFLMAGAGALVQFFWPKRLEECELILEPDLDAEPDAEREAKTATKTPRPREGRATKIAPYPAQEG